MGSTIHLTHKGQIMELSLLGILFVYVVLEIKPRDSGAQALSLNYIVNPCVLGTGFCLIPRAHFIFTM